MEENNALTEEIEIELEDDAPDEEAQPESTATKDNTGNMQKAMHSERARRKKAEERAELLESLLKRQTGEPEPVKSVPAPFEEALKKLGENEDNAPLVAALNALYSQTAKPSEDVMDMQIDKLAVDHPTAVEHKDDIIKTAKRYGIPVKSAYFMLYGEEASNMSRDDILREADLASAKKNAVAQVTPVGNVPPTSEKRKETIKIPAALVAEMHNAGISEMQYAGLQRAKAQYPEGIPASVLQSIYGGKGTTKKG